MSVTARSLSGFLGTACVRAVFGAVIAFSGLAQAFDRSNLDENGSAPEGFYRDSISDDSEQIADEQTEKITMSFHDFTVTAIDYTPLDLSVFKGKAVLLVNTATYCGFTPQYEGLETLWRDYQDRGFVLLGVPSNDFGAQEPGSEETIQRFCQINYQIDFPMTKKMIVKGGEGTAPLYDWLAENLGEAARPTWNFHKYLISPEGKPLAYFNSKVTPESDILVQAIEAALPR